MYIFIYLYVYKYVDVTIYLSQNSKSGNVFEAKQCYKRCSSRKLNIACGWNWNKSNIPIL